MRLRAELVIDLFCFFIFLGSLIFVKERLLIQTVYFLLQ